MHRYLGAVYELSWTTYNSVLQVYTLFFYINFRFYYVIKIFNVTLMQMVNVRRKNVNLHFVKTLNEQINEISKVIDKRERYLVYYIRMPLC